VSGITTLSCASISSVHSTRSHGARDKLDSHADTCSFGNQAYIVHDTGDTILQALLIRWAPSRRFLLLQQQLRMMTLTLTLHTFYFSTNHFILTSCLDKHLLCPAQMRCNQIIVNNIPLVHIPFNQCTHQDHSIVSTPQHHTLHNPLQFSGTTSYFETRKLTDNEVASQLNCIHVHMTLEQPWDPYNMPMGSAESSGQVFLRCHLKGDKLDSVLNGFS
jgi:hypothetical protein